MKKLVKCLRCGKKFEAREIGQPKKFCSALCRTRFGAIKRYNRLKNNKEYQDKQKEFFRKWRTENREHFNDLCREPNKLYQRRLKNERRDKGCCISCGTKLKNEDYTNCLACREKRKEWANQRKRMRRCQSNRYNGE